LATFGHDHLCTAKNYENLGILLRMQGKFEHSLENYYKCLAIELKLLPNNHPKLARTYEFIGDLQILTNEQSQGLTSYQNAITIQIKSLPDNHFEIANLYLKIFPLTHEKVQEINEKIKQIIDKQNRIKNQ
jgi:tetratricopeptide (TPR) repeat protein